MLDNLNTHKLGSLYEAFEPTEARRIAKRLELRYTPKHGSWLNMAEIELSVFSRRCLKGRIGDEETLRRHIGALETERNEAGSTIDWLFSSQDARVKLNRVYPKPNLRRLRQHHKDLVTISKLSKEVFTPILTFPRQGLRGVGIKYDRT